MGLLKEAAHSVGSEFTKSFLVHKMLALIVLCVYYALHNRRLAFGDVSLCCGSFVFTDCLPRVAFARCVFVRACAYGLRESSMSKKLFVGGLAWKTTTDDLRRAFEAYGEVSDAKVIMDRDTDRSRGFGFVTFSDDSAAVSAIGEMDGKELDGRMIRVNEANQEQGQRSGGGGNRRQGGRRGDFHRD